MAPAGAASTFSTTLIPQSMLTQIFKHRIYGASFKQNTFFSGITAFSWSRTLIIL